MVYSTVLLTKIRGDEAFFFVITMYSFLSFEVLSSSFDSLVLSVGGLIDSFVPLYDESIFTFFLSLLLIDMY